MNSLTKLYNTFIDGTGQRSITDALTHLQIGSIILAFILIYIVGGAIYRLCFSPLAKFPGPKIAALTSWYEFYFDIIRNGKYIFEIERLHKIYGR